MARLTCGMAYGYESKVVNGKTDGRNTVLTRRWCPLRQVPEE